MVSISPFALDKNDLKNLGQDRAVEFFRRLLWAEASRVGIGRHLIDVPACINVGDGGIDAFIENANPLFDDVIPKGTTGFQIKSSDLIPSECKKELHQEGNTSFPLKPEIKKVLDNGGSYILVLFEDLSQLQKQRRQEAINSELSGLGYKNYVRIYTINQLMGFAERFISLVSWLKPISHRGLSYSTWSERSDIKYPALFISDESRNRWTGEVVEKLRKTDGECPVFRVVGLSGIGKTRLVFEALAPDDLRNKVVYFSSAILFQTSDLYTSIQNDNSITAILVIDECDRRYHEDFVRAFSSKGPRIALITISYDFARVPPPTKFFNLTPLNVKDIKNLIKAEAKDLPDNIASRLSEFSDGYPRIATLLAESYLRTGGTSDEFIRISDDGLMDRLIGRPELGPDDFKKYKRVLAGISLFQKIGYEGILEAESKWLSEFIKIDWTTFREAVQYEKIRGIIQGENYLFVTPFMLRVYLLNDWWEGLGFTEDNFDKFVNSMPEDFRRDLIERFFEHIPFISTTQKGKQFAKAMLDDKGIYADGALLRSELGVNFFMKLTEADPESALHCLQRTVGTWSKAELLDFSVGRRGVVWALEKIAIWRDYFSEAAKLLLALGEAENETWSNNASGVFAELFSPAPGQLAPTEASLEERFVILKEALESESKERRALGLLACDQALQTDHFSRIVGNEKQGLRKTPDLWQPKTYQEWIDSYKRVWLLLTNKIDVFQGDERKKATDIILQHTRGIGTNPHLTDMVIKTLKILLAKKLVEETQVLTEVLDILHYEVKNMSHDTNRKWESFRDEISGVGFHSGMLRYVKLNLISDLFDDEGKRIDTVSFQVRDLAKQAFNDKSFLIPELSWLVTTDAQNGFQFGYELGKIDEDNSLLQTLVKAQGESGDNSSLLFLGGYFKSLFEREENEWDQYVEDLASDKKTVSWVPEITWRSGFNDRAAFRILHLAKSGQIRPDQFRIFQYGSVISNLSEVTFQEWIRFLLDTNDRNSVSISLGLYYFYYDVKKSAVQMPEGLTYEVISHETLFVEDKEYRVSTMDEFYWAEISQSFIQSSPEKALQLASVIIESFGREGSIVGGSHSRAQNILSLIAERFPKEVWWVITKYLGPPSDKRAFYLKDWLNGDTSFGMKRSGALSIFPLKEIFKWADENIEKRAWYLASFVPKELFIIEGEKCFAREVLIKYGKREDVRNNLMANFSSEGWSGNASTYYQTKKKSLLEFKKMESDEIVIKWLDEYVARIDQDIENAKIREERHG